MNLNSIRFKYTSTFCTIAALFVLLVIFTHSLVNQTEKSLITFSTHITPAISAVINADRDLYQARVAELRALATLDDKAKLNGYKKAYQENAKQAYDRMQKYKALLQEFPEVLNNINQFDSAYQAWSNASQQVFTLVQQGDYQQAEALSNGNAKVTFDALRDVYDIAGETADKKGKSLSEAAVAEVSSNHTILLVVSVIVICLTLAFGIIAPKAMADALEVLSIQLKQLNKGDGDLSRRINSKRKDEIGDVANDVDALMASLATLLKSILSQSSSVINGVNALHSGADHIQDTSKHQEQSVEAIATAVNEMTYAIKEVAQNAQLTADEVHLVNDLTNEGTAITNNAVTEIQALSSAVTKATEVILHLSENSSNIASVLDVIRGIAEQTNLLALNAAIEAARAGEQGRGFAVVADEVRTLAARTQQSTEDIQQMIETLQKDVNDAVAAIDVGNSASQTSVDLSQQTLEAFNKISSASNKVIEASAHTATATEEQSQVAEDVSKNLTLLSEQTSSNHALATENSDEAEKTSTLAQALSNSVAHFKCD